MDPEENSESTRIAERLRELVIAGKGSSEYDRLRSLLRLEVEGTSSILLPHSSNQELKALVEELEEADVSRLEKLSIAYFTSPEDDNNKEGRDFGREVKLLSQELVVADVWCKDAVPYDSLLTEPLEALRKLFMTGRFFSLTHLDLYWSQDSQLRFPPTCWPIAAVLEKRHLSGLLHLSLTDCDVSRIAIAMRVGRVSKLQHLFLYGDLSEGRLFHWEPREMIKGIIETGMLSHVVHLTLGCCALGAREMEVLAQAIETNAVGRLTHLDLSWNPIGDKGSDTVARLLRSNSLSSLEYLYLTRCKIKDGGMAAISRAIIEGSASRILGLKFALNGFADAGMGELLNALRSRHLLELQTLELSLQKNDFGRDNIAKAMPYLPFERPHPMLLLHKLDVVRNCMTEEGMLALAKFLKDGRYVGDLQKLLLYTYDPVSQRVAEAFVSAYVDNDSLTVDLSIHWPDRHFETNVEKYRKRNIALTSARDSLKNEKDVPATTAKVFVCGFEKVGKTTLRKSLQQTKLGAVFSRRTETKQRTRGIEVSEIVKKGKKGQAKVVLAIWDLAGQPEYRVLQSAFCLAESKATIFLIVCNALYQEKSLLYWLKFVASSCEQGVQRHVLVALNCFHGQECSAEPLWSAFIQKQRDTFQDLLRIHEHPFVLDARYSNSVAKLKKHLLTLSQNLLDGQYIPRICNVIPKYLHSWKTNHQFPVLPLEGLLSMLREKFNMLREEKKKKKARLLAALRFLHEAGNVVFFSDDMLRLYDSDVSVTGLVVLDPNWFCQEVVGKLLLPASFLEEQSSTRSIAEPDGSISIQKLHALLKFVVGNPQQVKSVVAMLMSLGLCYHAGPDKVLVPALTQRDDTRTWEECGIKDETAGQWVMGRSLTLLDQERTALPAALFHRLQVALAQDTKFGLDSSYTASKSSSIFKYGRMIVLIQFDVNENDPEDDRIDILVKPLGFMTDNPANIRKRQLDLIEDIMDKLEPISTYCCPGVQFNRNVIIPWNAAKPTLSMKHRELVLVEKVKERVQQHGLGMESNWCVDGWFVCMDDLLSAKDLEGLERIMSGQCKRLEEDALFLRIDIDGIDEAQDGILEGSVEDPPPGLLDPEGSYIVQTVRQEGRHTRNHVDRRVAELRVDMDRKWFELQKSIKIIVNKQNLILRKVQAFQSFSVAEKEASCPRFLYLTKSSDSGIWITVKKAFVSPFRIHFLCEARVEDGYMHEVQGQEGVEINNPKKWVCKLQPWLEWSLAIAIIMARVVGGVPLPGLDPLLSNMSSEGSSTALLVESAATLGEAILRSGVGTISDPSSSAQNHIELKQHAMMAAVVKDLIEETGRVAFWQKIGLRKVVLKDENGIPAKCAWICDACYHKYSNRGALVADISP